MGNLFIDRFTYLHFATGVVGNFWKVPLLVWMMLNVLFEIFENSTFGVKIVNRIPNWPGGKHSPDTLINSVGDVLASALGWLSVKMMNN